MILLCKKFLLLSISMLLLGVLVPRALAQQSATATLSGAVRDANGALVTGAQLTVTQKGTGIRREAISNDDGFFVITNLPAGNYYLQFADEERKYATEVFLKR